MVSTPIPHNPAERREWIKYQLRLHGSSLSALARDLGVHRSALAHAIIKSTSARMEAAIADKLGLAPADLWPERYTTSTTVDHHGD